MYKAGVEVEGGSQAELDLAKIALSLRELSGTTADPKISVEGFARAEVEILALERSFHKLSDTTPVVDRLAASLNKISGAAIFRPSFMGVLLAGLPALIPLAAGVAAGVGAIGIAFGAAAIGAGVFGFSVTSVLASATSDLAKLQAAELRLNTATTAATRKSARAALDQLKSTFAPGYLALIGQLQTFQHRWKEVSQAIAVPTLSVWLPTLTKGLQLLKPAVIPVANVFAAWGTALNRDFSNPAVFANIRSAAGAFGQFSAIQLGNIGQFIGDIASGIFSLGRDLASNKADLGAASGWLQGIGTGFATWARSSKARSEVQGFLRYLHQEGAVAAGILASLGKILPGIFKGASAAGQLELQAIAFFLGQVARLPKGWQAPLVEAAGAVLLLSKTGVISVGLKVIGVGAKVLSWLTGGVINLGAKSMQTAADTMAAAAAAMQRAADTMLGGSAAGGAAGAEGAAAARAGIGSAVVRGAAGALIVPAIAMIIGSFIPKNTNAQAAKDLGNTPGIAVKASNLLHLTSMGAWIDQYFSHPVRAWLENQLPRLFDSFRHRTAVIFTGIGHDTARIWNTMWDNTVGRAVRGNADVLRIERGWRHSIAATFDGIRHDIAATWDIIWATTTTRARQGTAAVVGWFQRLPGRVLGALFGLGHQLYAFAHAAVSELLAGAQSVGSSVVSWFKGLGHSIISGLKGLFGIHSPSSVMYGMGKNLVLGLHDGVRDHIGAISRQIGGHFAAGVGQWRGLVLKALSMEGLSPLLAGNVLYQMQTESGGRPNAINLTDSNAAAGDPSRGLLQVIMSTFRAYHWPGTSPNIYDPLANIAAALNYARHRYGPTLMRGGFGIGSGHGYKAGGRITEPIVGMGLSGRRYTFHANESVIADPQMRALIGLLTEIAALLRGSPERTGAAVAAGVGMSLGTTARLAAHRAAH